jgi:hypothetical protein
MHPPNNATPRLLRRKASYLTSWSEFEAQKLSPNSPCPSPR